MPSLNNNGASDNQRSASLRTLGRAFPIALLLSAPMVNAQDGPCRGIRRGDPNCFVKPTPRPTPSPSESGGTPVVTELVPKRLTYELSVARQGEGDVVEFTPVVVNWTLTVGVVGSFGSVPTPIDVKVCPAVQPAPGDFVVTCADVPRATPGRPYRGQMSVPAPPAGLQSPLRMVALRPALSVEDYGQQTVVAEGSTPLDVAARYSIAISALEILTTRSAVNDTLWVTLSGQVTADPPHFSTNPEACQTAGFTSWCVFNQPQGTFSGGRHTVTNVRAGSYDLVPGREPDLRLLFFVDNHDKNPGVEIMTAVANGFSKAGMIFLSAYTAEAGISGGAGVASQLDAEMEKLHSTMTASCDGKIAEDVEIIPNQTKANRPEFTLDAFTRATGRYADIPAHGGLIYRDTDGDLRCDRRGSAYRVYYDVIRESWRDWGFRPVY